MRMNISEAAHTRSIAADMILVAVRDLKKPKTMLEAALWFVGDDFAYWAALACVPYADPLVMFRRELKPFHARILLAQIARVVKRLEFVSILGEDSGYSRKDVFRLRDLAGHILEEIAGGPSKRVRPKRTRKPRQYWRIQKEFRQNANIAQ